MGNAVFEKYIEENFPKNREYILEKFEDYFENLMEINRFVNLVSRKTSDDDLWIKHFLDSILPARNLDLNNKQILDFGTGGGMPGIPLKIIFPSARVHLLDSRNKKIEALKKIIKKLDLSECFTIVSRLEELSRSWDGYFDLIVCRSVKILPKYKKMMLRLLNDDGEILFYKSRVMDDMGIFHKIKVLNLTHEAIGERKIVQIKKKWEGYE